MVGAGVALVVGLTEVVVGSALVVGAGVVLGCVEGVGFAVGVEVGVEPWEEPIPGRMPARSAKPPIPAASATSAVIAWRTCSSLN